MPDNRDYTEETPATITEDTPAAFVDDDSIYGTTAQPIPVPETNIGVDTDNQFYDALAYATQNSLLNNAQIEDFFRKSRNRDTVYAKEECMCEDSSISQVLKRYVSDSTQANMEGKKVWATSDDTDVLNHINYLINQLQIDKYVADWVKCLVEYGDVYVRLYRESVYTNVFPFNIQEKGLGTRKLLSEGLVDENMKINAFKASDHFANYVEMYPDPSDIFELTKYGKTYAYIQADSQTTDYTSLTGLNMVDLAGDRTNTRFKFGDRDLYWYGATEFVHACLTPDSSRIPETVQIFYSDDPTVSPEDQRYVFYTRRGEGMFYDAYRAWRMLSLLENAVLLNRLTSSSIVRVISVEVGDMSKEQTRNTLARVKEHIEQKAAVDVDGGMTEYLNPGAYENNVYIPVYNGHGNISTTTIGGDVDIGEFVDVDYFRDKLFGALGVPKQLFGYTGDSAGFDGGKSLSIISASYASGVVQIQSTICQMITDMINILLIDRGLDSYVGRFVIHMLAPKTDEDDIRNSRTQETISNASSIMNLIDGALENPTIPRLKILKALLAPAVTDQDVLTVLQDEIDRMEKEQSEQTETDLSEGGMMEGGLGDEFGGGFGGDFGGGEFNEPPMERGFGEEGGYSSEGGLDLASAINGGGSESEAPTSEPLPTPAELNIGDLTNPEM